MVAQSNFGRIGVLMGGPSTEREVSLKSGKAVYAALQQLGLDVVAIDIKSDELRENIQLIQEEGIACAFIALHGRFGEDGQIQEMLDTLKVPYTGSGAKASALAMDKIASREIFRSQGLNVPPYAVLERTSENLNWTSESDELGLPLVVKPSRHGSSIGLSIVEKEHGLKESIELAFSFDKRIIIEKFIAGREVTVGILDERALPVIEIIPKRRFFDYEAKYQPGMTDYRVPAQLEDDVAERVQQAGLRAHKLLGCSGCSRADIILSRQNIPFVLEVNTIPGLTATSLLPKAAQSAGIAFTQLCLKLIQLAYEKKPS